MDGKTYSLFRTRNEFFRVKEVPNVEKLVAIKGVRLDTVIGFVADVDDAESYTDSKQI